MTAHFRQTTDAADGVIVSIVVTEAGVDSVPTESLDQFDAFQHARRVLSTAADAVDLAGARSFASLNPFVVGLP